MYKKIDEFKTVTKLNNEGKEKMFKTNLADYEANSEEYNKRRMNNLSVCFKEV